MFRIFVCMRVCVHACVCSIRESILVQSSIQGMQECCSPSLSAQTVLQCLLELQHETAVSSLCPEECYFVHSVVLLYHMLVAWYYMFVGRVCGLCVCVCVCVRVCAWVGVYMSSVRNLVPL